MDAKRRHHVARARAKPRVAPENYLAPTAEGQRWFDDALRKDDPKPSPAACERLARKFQIIVNRHNNAELESRGPVALELLKDVSPAEPLNKMVREFTAVAKQLIVEANKIEDYAGGYQWGTVSLEDVKDILERIATSPEASAALVTQTISAPPSRRRPREVWHAAGREMARLIQAAMRNASYNGRLEMDDEESATASVGAAAINWAYGIKPKIKPAGFASAMKERDRSNKAKQLKSLTGAERFNERFPEVTRIKIMD